MKEEVKDDEMTEEKDDLKDDAEKVMKNLGGRPLGALSFRNKLKAELIEEHCGDVATQTQLLLIDALVSLITTAKEGQLSARDLHSNISSRTRLTKLLKELKPSQRVASRNPYDGMSVEELQNLLAARTGRPVERRIIIPERSIFDGDGPTYN